MNTVVKTTFIEPVSQHQLADQNAMLNEELAREKAELAREKAERAGEKAASDQLVIELNAKLRWYEEQYRLSKFYLYAKSSEHSPQQEVFVFNELEINASPELPEPTIETVLSKRSKTKGHREAQLKGLPVEVINYDLPESEQICKCCNGPLHRMSEEVREELKIFPAKISVVNHVRGVYSCRRCEKNEIATPIITAPGPTHAFPNSLASPSSVAYLMDQKYGLGLPLYRLEQSFERLGYSISRQSMCQWMIKGATLLKPVYERLKYHLLQRDILHADETTMQVLHEEGRKAETTSYMWLYRSGRDGPGIAVFEYQPTRAGTHPKAFLRDFSGHLHVDGYAAYDNIPNVTLVGCWAHARRNFIDALAAIPASARRPGSSPLAQQGLNFCNRLFAIERDTAGMTPEQRTDKRNECSKAHLAEFETWLENSQTLALPKTATGKAIGYCRNQWTKLTAFLDDGRLEIDNNRSERSIKPFVIGRKNWLFANTPKGAQTSATLYSIIETSKENQVIPLEYLAHLLTVLPSIPPNDTDKIDALMPWSPTLPDSCKLAKP